MGGRHYGALTMLPIEFIAFSGDCLIHARLSMFGERLTDMLNAQPRYTLSRVRLESLHDGHVFEIDSLPIERSDLHAVVATGPRGAQKLRVELEPTRMQVGIGPYTILGQLHGRPGDDPLRTVMKRDPMLPLTNATITFARAGQVVAQDAPALIINRELVEWIAPTADEADHFPDTPVRSPFALNLAKDFTGTGSL
jgi:hypothetical protein